MKAPDVVTLLLVIVGGINWGLVGIAQFDLVAAIFGGQGEPLARVVYVLVGVSAIWQAFARFSPEAMTSVSSDVPR